MPLLKHARKKQRQDNKKAVVQKNLKVHYKELIKEAREHPSQKALDAAYKAIDKAAKINLVHANKAAHLKSSVATAVAGKAKSPKAIVKPKSKAKTKVATKKSSLKKK